MVRTNLNPIAYLRNGPMPTLECDCMLVGGCNFGEPPPPPAWEFQSRSAGANDMYSKGENYEVPSKFLPGSGGGPYSTHWPGWHNPSAVGPGRSPSDPQGFPPIRRRVKRGLERLDSENGTADSASLHAPLDGFMKVAFYEFIPVRLVAVDRTGVEAPVDAGINAAPYDFKPVRPVAADGAALHSPVSARMLEGAGSMARPDMGPAMALLLFCIALIWR